MSPGERDPQASRRRFALGCTIGAIVPIVTFAWMVTGGTWDFFQHGLYSNFYDAQARALLHGHWYVPANVLTIEGIREGHRTYMYYGPVPALFRVPVLLVTDRLDSRLTDVSMLVAFVVALVFTSRLSWRTRTLVLKHRAVSTGECVVAGCTVAVVGLGSPLLFLASNSIVYHEAEIWGAALALGAFDFLTEFLVRPRLRTGLLAALFAALSILTRGSVGAGPVVALGLLAIAHLVIAARRRSARHEQPDTDRPTDRLAWLGLADAERSSTWGLLLGLGALIPVLLYVAINETKFGTAFALPLDHQVITGISAGRRATLAANGGSLFGLKFVPTGLWQYVRPDRLRVTRLFPFLTFPAPATVIGHVRYDARDWASSVTATMPVVIVAAAVGVFGISRRRRSGNEAPGLDLLRLPVVGAAFGTVGVLTIAFTANRYLADVLPLLVLTGLAGVHLLVARSATAPRWARVAGTAGLGALALFGLWSTSALALVYQRQLRPAVPLAMRDQFVAFQQRLDTSLFGYPPTDVSRASGLGTPAPAGSLVVIGHCSALYQSDGNSWDAVERSRAAGHFRMLMTFPRSVSSASASPSRSWPVLVNGSRGAADYLAVRPLGRDRVQFAYLLQSPGAQWITGAPVSVRPGHAYVVDAVLDSGVHQITATLDGETVFDLSYFVRGDRPVHVGLNPFGGPVARRLPGPVTSLRVTTPTCDALLRRLNAKA